MGAEKEPELEQESPAEILAGGKSTLRKAIDLITFLISLSHSIKVFAVKWQLIRHKLDELLCSLAAVENCNAGDNPSLAGEIQAIMDTLTDCSVLARCCVDLSFSGKLLMQSDLDIIAARFDTQINHLSEIYTAGMLTHSYAIVVSKPGIAASRDDLMFYMNDLLARLKIGGMEMKKQALIAFNEVLIDDEKYVKIALEIGDFTGLLVHFLDSEETQIQEQSAKAISLIVGFNGYRGVLIGAGVIAPLIRVLESGSELGQEWSVRCLMKLTENSENSWSVSAHGGVTGLMKICRNGDNGGELVGLACGVLRNLIGVEEIKRFMVEDGAISVFIKLVRSQNEISQINSIEFLQNLGCRDESIRQMIVKEDGIRALVCVLDPKSSSSPKPREMAFRAIVCFSSKNTLNFLMNCGFIDHTLHFLRNGELSIQELALRAVLGLCGSSEEAKIAMGDTGFMAELVKLLDSKSFEVREMAAEALSFMVIMPRNRKLFVKDDKSVNLLMQFLDPEEGNSGKRKFLLCALMSITGSSSGRKKIVNSGYVKNIEKLAGAEVSDAKRIVKRLSSNRLHRFFSGIIWHSG